MSKMTMEQHRDYVAELYTILCKIVMLHGADSPQTEAMASVYSKELIAYLERLVKMEVENE